MFLFTVAIVTFFTAEINILEVCAHGPDRMGSLRRTLEANTLKGEDDISCADLTQASLRCNEGCTVLVDKIDETYQSCDNYCQAHGRTCVGAWDEKDDDCREKKTYKCETKFTFTPDALCECSTKSFNEKKSIVSDGEQAPETSYSVVASTPSQIDRLDKNTSAPSADTSCADLSQTNLRCNGGCTVLVDDLDSTYQSCDNYCQAHNRNCVGAWNEDDDSCRVHKTYTCSYKFSSTPDALCECSPGRVITDSLVPLVSNDGEAALRQSPPREECSRIRLYWKKGYYWQESRKEKYWCMEGSKDGETIDVQKCDSSSSQKFRFIGGNPGQIQSCRNDKLCFEMKGSTVKLDQCNSSEKDQGFKRNGKNSKFKLEPRSKSGCLTQQHHPKSGEKVYAEKCSRAQKDETVYWRKY